MKTRCSCEGKKFPHAFRKDEVHIRYHDFCCNERNYSCAKCMRHLGSQCMSVDEDDDDLYDGLPALEYIRQFSHFEKEET